MAVQHIYRTTVFYSGFHLRRENVTISEQGGGIWGADSPHGI